MKHKNRWVVIGLLSVALIWGSGFIATQVAIDAGMTSAFIMFVRFASASLIMGVAGWRQVRQIDRTEAKRGMLVGGFLFLAFLLQTIGLENTPPSVNAFVTATCVVMVPFFSWFFLHHRPPIKIFVAAVLCFGGIVTLSFSAGGGLNLTLGVGAGITFLGAIAFALHTISLGAFSGAMDTGRLTFLQISTAAVLSFAAFLMVDRDFSQFQSVKGLLAILYLAVFSTCIAYFIQTLCQRVASPSTTAIIISTESLFGTGLSVLLGFEPFHYFLVVGGVAVFLSILIVETKIFDRYLGGAELGIKSEKIN